MTRVLSSTASKTLANGCCFVLLSTYDCETLPIVQDQPEAHRNLGIKPKHPARNTLHGIPCTSVKQLALELDKSG
ncbi:MAG: hypothetical protein CMM07_16695 [Rhodopirellula sp.]|nr:hypothetical protein [Rhodopirellula sp.]